MHGKQTSALTGMDKRQYVRVISSSQKLHRLHIQLYCTFKKHMTHENQDSKLKLSNNMCCFPQTSSLINDIWSDTPFFGRTTLFFSTVEWLLKINFLIRYSLWVGTKTTWWTPPEPPTTSWVTVDPQLEHTSITTAKRNCHWRVHSFKKVWCNTKYVA